MSKAAVFPAPESKTESEEGTVFAPRFDADGLVPVVATSAKTGEVLMLAYMNAEALARTIETGEAHYWSRSRGQPLAQGRGERQHPARGRDAHRLRPGRDLAEGGAAGADAACHTGRRSCFYRAVPLGRAPGGAVTLIFVDAERQFDPEAVYRHADAAKGTLKSSE